MEFSITVGLPSTCADAPAPSVPQPPRGKWPQPPRPDMAKTSTWRHGYDLHMATWPQPPGGDMARTSTWRHGHDLHVATWPQPPRGNMATTSTWQHGHDPQANLHVAKSTSRASEQKVLKREKMMPSIKATL